MKVEIYKKREPSKFGATMQVGELSTRGGDAFTAFREWLSRGGTVGTHVVICDTDDGDGAFAARRGVFIYEVEEDPKPRLRVKGLA